MSLPLAPMAPRTAKGGMVAAADHLAASAGLEMLRQGGSGADAAVATAAAMAVVGPHLCGLGGDLLAVVCPPGSPPQSLLSIGRAGAGVDANRLRDKGLTSMPVRGDLHSVPVPGAVDGWLALLARYGRLPLATVFAPAIELAEEGFAASIMLSLASHLVAGVPGAEQLCPNGPLSWSDTVRLPGIARTLRAIVGAGRDGFYGGEFGRGLLALGQGIYAEADLTRDLAEWGTPVRQHVWGHELWAVPPPSQSYLSLAGAFIAESVGLGQDPSQGEWAHLIVESARAAGHERPDALFDGADGAAMVDPAHLRELAARIRHNAAAPPDVASSLGSPSPGVARIGDGDTTHLCAIDRDGLGVSLTQSNALDFGSHVVEPSTGIFLHNRGVGFSLTPGHRAELGPGRRPPHTLSPMVATTADGALTHLIGAMGGDSQPQIMLQLLARMLHAGQDPAAALAAPRLSLDAPSAGPFRLWWGDDLTVLVEANAPEAWASGLAGRGHRVRQISAFDPTAVGCAQVIAVRADPDGSRLYVGAADPRSPEGATLGR